MASLRTTCASVLAAAALAFQPTPAQAVLNVTIGQPPEIGWGTLVEALADGKLDSGDLADAANLGFQAFWSAASNIISKVQICREAYAHATAGRVPPFTFYINMTVVSADGSNRFTYQHPVRVVGLPGGVLGVGVAGANHPVTGQTYIRMFRCGDVGGAPEPEGEDDSPEEIAEVERALGGDGGAGDLLDGVLFAREASTGVESYAANTEHGRVRVYLPDDMAAGDTISGTVVVEPAGDTDAERQANTNRLEGYGIEVAGVQANVADRRFRVAVGAGAVIVPIVLREDGGRTVGLGQAPVVQPAAIPPNLQAPPIAEGGQPLQIDGPFDGNAGNTSVNVGGHDCPILAESPRQAVIAAPPNPTGPVTVTVRENGNIFRTTYNNIRIDLSAGRTTLRRGERTRVTLRVQGLQGVEQPFDVTLNASPSVALQGGNQQTVRIAPRAVNETGEFTREFNLRVNAAGPFDITAQLAGGG